MATNAIQVPQSESATQIQLISTLMEFSEFSSTKGFRDYSTHVRFFMQLLYVIGQSYAHSVLKPFADLLPANKAAEQMLEDERRSMLATFNVFEELFDQHIGKTVRELKHDEFTMSAALKICSEIVSLYSWSQVGQIDKSQAVTVPNASYIKLEKMSTSKVYTEQLAPRGSGCCSTELDIAEKKVNAGESSSLASTLRNTENSFTNLSLLCEDALESQKKAQDGRLKLEDLLSNDGNSTFFDTSSSHTQTATFNSNNEYQNRYFKEFREAEAQTARQTAKSSTLIEGDSSLVRFGEAECEATSSNLGDSKSTNAEMKLSSNSVNSLSSLSLSSSLIQSDVVVLEDATFWLSKKADALWEKGFGKLRPVWCNVANLLTNICANDCEAVKMNIRIKGIEEVKQIQSCFDEFLQNGQVEIARILIKSGAPQVNSQGTSWLLLAIKHKRNDLVRELLSSQGHLLDSQNRDFIDYSAIFDNIEMFDEFLLTHRRQIEQKLEILFCRAVINNAINVCNRMVELGLIPDERALSDRVLNCIARSGNYEITSKYLSYVLKYQDQNQSRALKLLLNGQAYDLSHRKETIALLIQYPDQRQSIGLSELGFAAFRGDVNEIRRQLICSASWVCDEKGANAFQWAVRGNNVRKLRQACRFTVSEEEYYFAVEWARMMNYHGLLKDLASISSLVIRKDEQQKTQDPDPENFYVKQGYQQKLFQLDNETIETFRHCYKLFDRDEQQFIRAYPFIDKKENKLVTKYYRAFANGWKFEYMNLKYYSITYAIGSKDYRISRHVDKYIGTGMFQQQKFNYYLKSQLEAEIIMRRLQWNDPLAQKQIDLAKKLMQKPGWTNALHKDVFLRSAQLETDFNVLLYLEARKLRQVRIANVRLAPINWGRQMRCEAIRQDLKAASAMGRNVFAKIVEQLSSW